MKIGENIQEIREVEKNFKRSYVAERLGISTRAYSNIENNVTEITYQRLEAIAKIFECDPIYILSYKESKKEFYNHFHNHLGNNGINIMNQGILQRDNQELDLIHKLQQELLTCERNRIALLEALLRINKIDF